MLEDRFRPNIFAEFDDGRIHRPNESKHYAATKVLSLQRMGKLSVHAPIVKSAFSYEFLTALSDPTKLHEALALYERFAVANTDDPYWRLIRARCAKLMHLPETLKLYEQVAADMTGVPPSDEVLKMWEANREEFDLDGYTIEAWRKQMTTFVYDAKGLDVPGSPPIEGSPFPLIDVAAVVGSEAGTWAMALDGPPQTHANTLDDIIAQADKHGELPWLDGRGFLNTGHALTSHLLGKPTGELAELRELQETGFQKAIAKAADVTEPLTLFRRYPWSESAQRLLLESAQQALFAGESHGAFRSFQDILRHAEAKDLREQAQVGLWVSLAQFAAPAALTRAFDDMEPDATWPWNGKRVKTEVIMQQLSRQAAEIHSPSLASLTQHTVRLPPMPLSRSRVFSVDMQREGDQLLVSSPMMLAMFAADNPTKPLWTQTRRLYRQSSGAEYFLPRFSGQELITTWGGFSVGDYHGVVLNRNDGSVVSSGDPHDLHSRFLYRMSGSPAIADNKVFTVQIAQSYALFNRMHQYTWYGDIGLGCFDIQGMKHRWTQRYDAAQTTGEPRTEKMKGARPVVDQGAVYFISGTGHVVRSDIRDGEMEWMHFFRPIIDPGPYTLLTPSPWCLGSAPIVTEDKVICMPKYTGYLFALDKETGRRIWAVPLLRGHEVLGAYEDQVLVVGANSIYAIDIDTGQVRWGRQISPQWGDGFQLPRAQLIGSSVYCGTKNTLYRFDARNGALMESRPWAMGSEVPMSFLIAGTDLYAISDLPMKDETFERQLAEHHSVIHPAGAHSGLLKPLEFKDGSQVVWRDGMLIRFKGEQLLWSRFLSNDHIYGGRMSARNDQVLMSWPAVRSGAGAFHDAATGQLLEMSRSYQPGKIKIGGK